MTAPTSAGATPVPTPSLSAAGAPLDPFIQACLERIHYLDQVAALMLWAALLLALLTGAVAVYAAYTVATKQPAPVKKNKADLNESVVASISPAVLEPLGKFLEVLNKLQVWFFLFLAGVALAWFASGISDGRCGNAPDAPAPATKQGGTLNKPAAKERLALPAPTASAS